MTYLDRIVASHREAARKDTRTLEPLLRKALSCAKSRGFSRRIAETAFYPPGGNANSSCGSTVHTSRNAEHAKKSEPTVSELAVIAEIKRKTPSEGDLRMGHTAGEIDAGELARQYEQGGAACLSVLTDSAHFGGSAADLKQAKASTGLPVLRKDFTVDRRDVLDAKIMGADCVLLIVAVVSDVELSSFHELAVSVDLDVLVEVHDERELEKALSIGATLIGVNQRDLTTFEVDTDRAVRMASLMPTGVIRVAESGIRSPEDARRLTEAGYHAILVGEMLVKSDDPVAELQSLRATG